VRPDRQDEEPVTPDQDDDHGERTMFISRARLLDQTPAVPDPVGHYLVVLEGGSLGKRLEIGTEPTTIGRGSQQTLVCDDRDVSRLHARVSLTSGAVLVEDMQSTNGTFVDEVRITGAVTLKEGSRIRVGGQVLKYESRSRADVKKAQELERDIRKASDYVHSLLPPPLTSGPILTAWRFVPSTQLGGDAFGYYWLDPGTFVFYLVDVSGHGAGSAMHSVSVLNVLRQRALPDVDFTNPAQVLACLNSRFQTSEHNGLYFTMWYGVYHPESRVLYYGTAGHGPAILVPSDKSTTQELGMSALMIGMLPDQTYEVAQATIPPGSTLWVFSDGAYEIVTKTGDRWDLEQFLPLLLQPSVAGQIESERIYQAVKQAAATGPLEDDFSLMSLTFP
jgi:serine phosphatase RsbU (regulator of sigma subunit)